MVSNRRGARESVVVAKRVKLPEQVLVRVQLMVDAKRSPAPPEPPKARKLLAREKVVAALKKLHPMD